MLEILIQYEVRSERCNDYSFSISTSECRDGEVLAIPIPISMAGYSVDVESPRRSLTPSMKGLWWVLAAGTCTCDTWYM
jgi:hypothetical protein